MKNNMEPSKRMTPNDSIGDSSTYFIHKDYEIRPLNSHDDERKQTDLFQAEVYQWAAHIMKSRGYKAVADVGCGSGYKLIKYMGEFKTIGTETEPAISFLRQKYPDRKWMDSGKPEESFGDAPLEADLVICSDVVEHIRDPDELMAFLSQVEFKKLVISTPDRDVLGNWPSRRSKYPTALGGPPRNTAHVREWTYSEFIVYLSRYFFIEESRHGVAQVDCQMHLCSRLLSDL